jgi:hypothetical protein
MPTRILSRALWRALAVALFVAIAAPAHAGKISPHDAIKVAKTWRTLMNAEKSASAVDAALAQTGSPFWYVPRPPVSDTDAIDKCAAPDAGALADAAAVRAVIACVFDHAGLIDDAAYGPQAATWKAVTASAVPKPMRAQSKQLAKLAKDHALVLETLSIPAPATEWVLYVVGRSADGRLRVDGVLRAGRDDSASQP